MTGKSRAMTLIFTAAMSVVIVIAGAGCAADPTAGYSTMSLYSDDVATIAVPIFENHSAFRDIEFDLTDAVIKEIEARTPYSVKMNGAETILTGTVQRVDLTRLSASRQTGLAGEMVVGLTIDFEWKDARTGRERVMRRDFSGHGLFLPSAPIGEPIELGRFAAVQQLARDIVDEMRSDW